MIIPRKRTRFRKPFYGTARNGLCVLKYLKKAYKNACVVIPSTKKGRSITQEDISLRWSEDRGSFVVPRNYWALFKRPTCSSKRFIIIPFGFSCETGYGHANFMIYDREERALERFDPYGLSARSCLRVDVDDALPSLFKAHLGRGFIHRYYPPLKLQGPVGIQRLQESEDTMDRRDPPEGYCKAWCCLYAELRLLNPDINRDRVLPEFIKNIGIGHLTGFIREYSQVVQAEC